MFAVQETKSCAPGRFMPDPAFEPELVESIAGSIAVASQDTVQTEQNLIRLPAFLNGLCETERGRRFQANQISIKPLGRGPILCRVESRPVAAIRKCTPKPFQITFGPTGARKSASNKTNLHKVKSGKPLLNGNQANEKRNVGSVGRVGRYPGRSQLMFASPRFWRNLLAN